MKRFIVGLFAWFGFVVVLVIGAGVGLWWWWAGMRDDEARIPDPAVLSLRLKHRPAEDSLEDPWLRFALRRPSMRDLVDALDRAAADPRVKVLVADLGETDLGLAQAQELRQAVARFRRAGKPTVAFADSFGEVGTSNAGYYLATAFDQIWLQASGDVSMVGLSIEGVFVRGLLDRLGIEPQIGQRKEFKNAMSPATDTAFTPPVREMLEALARSLFDQVTADIASDRRIDAAILRRAVNNAPHDSAAARQIGLVDRIGYWDEARAEARRLAGADAETVTVARYLNRAGRPNRHGTTVALIHGSGPIVRGGGDRDPLFGHGTLGADPLVRAFDDASGDRNVAAILFRIDSPGGSYVASDTIWRAVMRARERGKPVVVSMGNVAASGGYFVAAPADRIVAQPGTLTGSIGVVFGKLVAKDLAESIGITFDRVRIGEHAGMWSASRPFTPAERAKVEQSLDRVYDDFTAKVAQGRQRSREQIEAAAKGRVWTGAQAHEFGLVDALGGYQTALDEVRKLLKLPAEAPLAIRVYPKEKDSFGLLYDLLLDGEETWWGGAIARLGLLVRLAQRAQPWAERLDELQATLATESLQLPRLETRY